MRIEDFLHLANVHVALRAKDKPTLLGDLARLAAPPLEIAPSEIERALSNREALGSTGLGEGIALPHARLETLRQVFGLLYTLKSPIPFDSVDERPVDLVFLLLLPTGSTGAHLGALAAAARKLRDPEIAAGLRRARGALEAYAFLAGGAATTLTRS